jgi:spore maturation protein SpmA
MPKELYGYHEAASIQLVPSSVLCLASTSSTVSLLLLTLASPAVVAKTCMSAIQIHVRRLARQANAYNNNQEPSEATGVVSGGIKGPETSE